MWDNAQKDGSKVKGNVAVAPIVGPNGAGASTVGGYNNGINVFSKNKATARDFIAFVQNDENQMSFADAAFPPVLKSVYDDAGPAGEVPVPAGAEGCSRVGEAAPGHAVLHRDLEGHPGQRERGPQRQGDGRSGGDRHGLGHHQRGQVVTATHERSGNARWLTLLS